MCPWRLCISLLVVVQALTPRLKPYCSCLVLEVQGNRRPCLSGFKTDLEGQGRIKSNSS